MTFPQSNGQMPQQYAPQPTPSWAGPAQPQAAAQQQEAPSRDVEQATFGGDGGPRAPFLNIGPATTKRPAYTQPGQPLGGTIVRIQEVHAHKRGAYDQATGKYGRDPMYYKKGPKAGQAIMQFKLTLQTDLRDPSIEGDTGLRALELDGMDAYWLPVVPFNCKSRAARLAVEAAKAPGLSVGGQFLIAYTRTVQVPGLEIDPIDWVAQYTPPGSFATFESAPVAAPKVAPVPANVLLDPSEDGPGPHSVPAPAQQQPTTAPPAWAQPTQVAATPATPSWA